MLPDYHLLISHVDTEFHVVADGSFPTAKWLVPESNKALLLSKFVGSTL